MASLECTKIGLFTSLASSINFAKYSRCTARSASSVTQWYSSPISPIAVTIGSFANSQNAFQYFSSTFVVSSGKIPAATL